MPDFRIVDDADEHAKMRLAGLAAVGLWSMAGARAMRDLTDGWVPAHYVATWPSGKRHASTLVKVGLWVEEARKGVPGYRFHDWGQVQRTASQIQTERMRNRDRKAAQRRPNDARPADVPVGQRADRPRDARRDNNGTHSGRPVGVPAESRKPPYPLPPEGEGGEGSSGKQRAGLATVPPEEPDHDEELTRQPCGRVHSSSESCGGCGAARRMAGDQDRAAEQARRTAQQQIRKCQMCDVEGFLHEVGRFTPVSPYTRCDHRTDHAQQVADARDEAS